VDKASRQVDVLIPGKTFLARTAMAMSIYLLVACGTTDTIDSSESAESNGALILGASRGTALFSPRPVVIKSVDGRPVSFAAGSVRVSAGIHVLLVTCYQSLFARNTHELTVSVQAGETYALSSQIRPDKISDDSPECEAQISRVEE
jgi:hypothetical protein